MGLEWIRQRAKAYTKRWDRYAIDLRTPPLFSEPSVDCGRSLLIHLTSNVPSKVGDDVIVQENGTQLVAIRGIDKIGYAPNPPEGITAAVRQACNVASARVIDIHPLSRTIEVLLC